MLGGDVLQLHEDVQRPPLRVADRCEGGPHPSWWPLAGDVVLELHHVDGPGADLLQRVRDLLGGVRDQLGVRPPDHVGLGPSYDAGERPVDPHEATGQRQRGHADRGLVEHLSEPLEVLAQHRRLMGLGPGVGGGLVSVSASTSSRRRCSRASNGRDFSQNSAAPSARARSVRPFSSKPLNITTRVSGETSRIRGSASRPSISGMDTSSSISVGWCSASQLDGSVSVGRLADDLQSAGDPQPGAHQHAHVGRVVDDDDRRHGWLHEVTLSGVLATVVPACRRGPEGVCDDVAGHGQSPTQRSSPGTPLDVPVPGL